MKVCLQLFAFDEPGMGEVLDRWAADKTVHDVDYWACVTPADGSTMHEAESNPMFDLVECPPGKLSSRNLAHNMADEYDVIAVTDADAYPVRERAIDGIIEPYRNGVAATNGFPTEDESLFGMVLNAGERLGGVVKPHMNGQFSSFRQSAWGQLRDFDESVDQTDVFEVRQEEEFWFYNALSEIGNVEPAVDARVFNDPRRWWARVRDAFSVPQDDYGERRGTDTFNRRR